MPRRLTIDRVLLATIMLLCMGGLVMIYSASAVIAAEQFDNPYHFLIRQIAALVVGVAVMVAMIRTDYRSLKNGAIVYGALGITATLLIVALMSPSVNGTHRWIFLGPATLQPAEFAKLAIILFLAWRLQRDPEDVNNLPRNVIPCLVLSGFVVFLVMLQPDLGTSVSIALCVAVMLYTAGVRVRYLGAMALAAMLVFVLVMKGYQMERLMSFLDPDSDPLGAGYQVIQSKISIGAGGELGRGLGEGQQKLFFLPYPYTDFIFSVIGEELGLIGTVAFMGAFLILLWRGLRVASRAPALFGSYLAAGITMFLVMQAMINMGVTLGMLPAKGLPLPFVSYGGSSLVAGLMASGLLLNISQHSN